MGPVYSLRSGRDDPRGCCAGSGRSLAAWAGGIYRSCAGTEGRKADAAFTMSALRSKAVVGDTLIPFSLSLNASTYAHTFVWRRMQWASAAVHPETSEERFDEQPERHNRRRRGSRARGLFLRLPVGQRHRRWRRTGSSRHNRKRRLISAAPLAASPARRPGQEQA